MKLARRLGRAPMYVGAICPGVLSGVARTAKPDLSCVAEGEAGSPRQSRTCRGVAEGEAG